MKRFFCVKEKRGSVSQPMSLSENLAAAAGDLREATE